MEEVSLFAVLWALWLHGNKVLFKRRVASVDNIVHNAEGFVSIVV